MKSWMMIGYQKHLSQRSSCLILRLAGHGLQLAAPQWLAAVIANLSSRTVVAAGFEMMSYLNGIVVAGAVGSVRRSLKHAMIAVVAESVTRSLKIGRIAVAAGSERS